MLQRNVGRVTAVTLCVLLGSGMHAIAQEVGLASASRGVSVDVMIDHMELGDAPGQQRISMNFQEARLQEVLKVLSEQSALNLIASKDVEDQQVSLFLENVKVQDALDQILKANELVSERLEGSDIYTITAAPEAGEIVALTETRVYKMRHAHLGTTVLGHAAQKLIKALTPFEALLGRGEGGSPGGASNFLNVDGGIEARSDKIRSGGIELVVFNLLTDQGSMVIDERTNSMIVTDVSENFQRIESAIAQLDVRVDQVLVEVELIETTVDFDKTLGLEFGQADGTLLKFTPANKATEQPFEMSRGAGNLATSVDATIGTHSLGLLDTSQLKVVLKALTENKETRILARPKVLTLDNQSAVIRLTEDTAIAITSSSQTDTGTITSTVERTLTGVVLSVTPQINEGGYITMLVEPSVNKPVSSTLLSESQAIFNPKERSARALVRVKEGNTFVLGGLIDRTEEVSTRKVPILSAIPIVGRLFEREATDIGDTDLVVFITPHIVREQRYLADLPNGALTVREQETIGSRDTVIESALSAWEQRRRNQP